MIGVGHRHCWFWRSRKFQIESKAPPPYGLDVEGIWLRTTFRLDAAPELAKFVIAHPDELNILLKRHPCLDAERKLRGEVYGSVFDSIATSGVGCRREFDCRIGTAQSRSSLLGRWTDRRVLALGVGTGESCSRLEISPFSGQETAKNPLSKKCCSTADNNGSMVFA